MPVPSCLADSGGSEKLRLTAEVGIPLEKK
jgi:hypothetical protein